MPFFFVANHHTWCQVCMSTYHGSQCSTLQIGFLCRFVPPFVGSKYITPMKKYIVLSKIANNSWNRLRLCVFRRMGNGNALEIGEYAFLSKRWLGAWNGPLIIVVLHALLVFLFGANKQSKIHLLRLISAEKQGWSTSQKSAAAVMINGETFTVKTLLFGPQKLV